MQYETPEKRIQLESDTSDSFITTLASSPVKSRRAKLNLSSTPLLKDLRSSNNSFNSHSKKRRHLDRSLELSRVSSKMFKRTFGKSRFDSDSIPQAQFDLNQIRNETKKLLNEAKAFKQKEDLTMYKDWIAALKTRESQQKQEVQDNMKHSQRQEDNFKKFQQKESIKKKILEKRFKELEAKANKEVSEKQKIEERRENEEELQRELEKHQLRSEHQKMLRQKKYREQLETRSSRQEFYYLMRKKKQEEHTHEKKEQEYSIASQVAGDFIRAKSIHDNARESFLATQ